MPRHQLSEKSNITFAILEFPSNGSKRLDYRLFGSKGGTHLTGAASSASVTGCPRSANGTAVGSVDSSAIREPNRSFGLQRGVIVGSNDQLGFPA